MLGVREGLERVSACLRPVPRVGDVRIWDAAGLVLEDDVRAPEDYPPVPKAEYDGYAVRSADTPGELRVVGSAPLGTRAPDIELGEALYVTTGAYLPSYLDAVVPQEDAQVVERGGSTYIRVEERVEPWSYVDPPGYHARRGDVMVNRGRVLTRLDIVALASLGVDAVPARRRVRVRSLSVGSELSPDRETPPSSLLRRGVIPESNSMLLAWYLELRAPFAELVGSAVLPDDPAAISREAERALTDADVLVTFGGSGPSSVDFTRRLVESADCSAGDFRMKPGKPAKLAALDGKLIAVLPGHPLAALHATTRLLDPLMHVMAGAVERPWPSKRALLLEELPERKRGFSQQYLVKLSGGERGDVATIIYRHGTGVTSKLAGVDALLNLDEDEVPRPGDYVDVDTII